MSDVSFWIFAALLLVSSVLVISCRSPINSAMALIFGLFCMSGIFVLLEAYFLAAVQILVYAGAVMVLFLFVIMLLDLKAEERHRLKLMNAAVGAAVAAVFARELYLVVRGFPERGTPLPPAGTVEGVGRALFSDYLLPFEVTSLLLLVAMIGVVLLSRKETK